MINFPYTVYLISIASLAVALLILMRTILKMDNTRERHRLTWIFNICLLFWLAGIGFGIYLLVR